MALKGKAAGQKIQEPSRHYYSDFKETFFYYSNLFGLISFAFSPLGAYWITLRHLVTDGWIH